MIIDIDEIDNVVEDNDLKLIHEVFHDLKDNRYQPNVRFPLTEVFFLVLCAQLCGYESFREYTAYGKLKLNFLRRFLPYENEIPSHKTIRSVLAIFYPDELETRFRDAIQIIINKRKAEKSEENEDEDEQDTIAIDGKRHRGLKATATEDNILHTVSAYSTKEDLILCHENVADKSNEITAIPELLDALDISGHIVTIDAMGCQVAIADKIRSKGGDYILALKGNQGNLYDSVRAFFDNPDNADRWDIFEASNKGHGRHEYRKCTVGGKLKLPDEYKKWTGLQSIIRLDSTRTIKGQEAHETKYYISSLSPNPKKAAKSIRVHWGVENKCHWCLDVIFGEDNRIMWDKNIAKNESMIRRLALCLLREYKKHEQEPLKSKKIAIKTLRKNLVADDERMEEILSCLT
jgi:predicted transposase YbfD/YdcC